MTNCSEPPPGRRAAPTASPAVSPTTSAAISSPLPPMHLLSSRPSIFPRKIIPAAERIAKRRVMRTSCSLFSAISTLDAPSSCSLLDKTDSSSEPSPASSPSSSFDFLTPFSAPLLEASFASSMSTSSNSTSEASTSSEIEPRPSVAAPATLTLWVEVLIKRELLMPC